MKGDLMIFMKKKFVSKIQFKITLSLMVLSIMISMVIGYASFSYSKSLLVKESEEKLLWMVKSHANQFSSDLLLIEDRVKELNRLIVSTIDFNALNNQEDYLMIYEEFLTPFFYEFARYRTDSFSSYVYFDPKWSETPHDIYFVDGDTDRLPDRQEYIPFSYYDNIPTDDDDKYWWYGPVATGAGIWTNPYKWTLINDEVINVVSYVEPVYKEGVFIGVVGSYYKFKEMNDTVLNLGTSTRSYAILINEKQDVIIHPSYISGTRYNSSNLSHIENGKYKDLSNLILSKDTGIHANIDYVSAFAKLSNGWTLYFTQDINEVYSPIDSLLSRFIVIFIVSLLMILVTSFFLGKNLTLGFQYLKNGIELMKEGRYNMEIPKLSNDEIGEISDSFNDMSHIILESEHKLMNINSELENRVNIRTDELLQQNMEIKKINNELSTTLLKLQITQEKLITTEKNVSLERLVNGIAHEINTPVGNCITLQSYSLKKIDTLKNSIESKEHEKVFNDLRDINDMTLSSLKIAANLIVEFKKISANKNSYHKTELDLSNLIKKYISIKKMESEYFGIDFQCDLDDTIIISSYKNAIHQILDHFISNTIQHGFGEIGEKVISISCHKIDSSIILEFCDNGSGIIPDRINDVFEPFYTTNHNNKSVGLGLFIVSNIVYVMLDGHIVCQSDTDKGTCFILNFPDNLENRTRDLVY
jgi:signal transduction histidine kinase